MDICRTEVPRLEPTGEGSQLGRCWLDDETKKREGARVVEDVHRVAS